MDLSKHISRDRYPGSLFARRSDLQKALFERRSDLQKTQHSFVRVGPCL
jgi:hypothetical protein